jgi:hypothetical protein
MRMNNRIYAALNEANTKVENLIAATEGDDSKCAVFKSQPGYGVEPFTDAQKAAIRRYVSTWIEHPLKAAITGIDNPKDWRNEGDLEAIYNGGWRR